MTRQTHTHANLEVSQAVYDEIAGKLRAAGYDDAFGRNGEIDMHGIALVVACPDDPTAESGRDGEDDVEGGDEWEDGSPHEEE